MVAAVPKPVPAAEVLCPERVVSQKPAEETSTGVLPPVPSRPIRPPTPVGVPAPTTDTDLDELAEQVVVEASRVRLLDELQAELAFKACVGKDGSADDVAPPEDHDGGADDSDPSPAVASESVAADRS